MLSKVNGGGTALIGKVVGVHALKGEVRVLPYGEIDWIEGESLYLVACGTKPAPDAATVKVSALRPHKGVMLVTLEGVTSIDDAEALVGLDIHIDFERLPELLPGEYYHQDLFGMEVFTRDGESLGKITGVITTGANDVYQVKGAGGETLLPAIKEVILSVDIDNRKMVVKPVSYELEDEV